VQSKEVFTSSAPKELRIDESTKGDYEGLLNGTGKYIHSPFTNLTYYNVFLVAMSLGAIRGKRRPLNKKLNFIKSQLFKNNYGEALIQALAVFEIGSPSIIIDKNEMYSIAEEYANGGLEILVEQIVTGSDSIAQEFEEKWKIYISDTLKLIQGFKEPDH